MNYAYADANIFIAYFNNETGRADILDQLFEEIENDTDRRLLTSVLTITEVSKLTVETLGKPLHPDFEMSSDNIWKNANLLEFADLSEVIARRARQYIRQFVSQGLSLKMADSIHLATAKVLNIPTVLTYDEGLDKYAELLDLTIIRPSVDQPRLL